MGAYRSLRAHGDAALAVGLTLLSQGELWLLRVPDPDDLGRVVGGGEQAAAGIALGIFTLSLAWRRRFPFVVLACALVAAWLSPTAPFDQSIGFALALVVATWSIGSGVAGTRAILGGVGVAALGAAIALGHPTAVEDVSDVAATLLVVGGPWLAGVAMRLRRERVRELEARAGLFERQREDEARRAVADERARIARELHDVVAHAISVIVLQARGGRRALSSDADATRQALDAIEATGSQALAEMRRLIGVLRPDGESPSLSPQPSLRDVAGLVDKVRDSGLPIELTVEGEPLELPAGIDLAAFRIIQEALTNALRHAGPTSATVVVRYGQLGLEIEITDSGASSASADREGHGLVGMRERASLYGGSVETGPRPGGGFRVLARLPLEIGDA